MSIKNKILLTCRVLLFLAMPLTAWAADFTFNVPVNVQNQGQDITQGEVLCYVGKGKQWVNEGGVQYFTLDSLGNFQDTVTVDFNATEGSDPATVNSYRCFLKLIGESGMIIESSGSRAFGNYTVQGNF